MLTDFIQKVKTFFTANQKDIFLTAFVFVVSVVSFGLGRLSAIWPVKEPITIEEPKDEGQKLNAASPPSTEAQPSTFGLSPSTLGNYVASRNGSSYHLLNCPGAKQIKEENKVWFATKAEAERSGYKPAGNCPGL